jgi:hypothetical protein
MAIINQIKTLFDILYIDIIMYCFTGFGTNWRHFVFVFIKYVL